MRLSRSCHALLVFVVSQICLSAAQQPSCSTPADIIPLGPIPSFDDTCTGIQSLPELQSVVAICDTQVVHFNWTSQASVAYALGASGCQYANSVAIGDVVFTGCIGGDGLPSLQYNVRTHQLLAPAPMGGLACANALPAYSAAMGASFYIACLFPSNTSASGVYLTQLNAVSSAILVLPGWVAAIAVSANAALVYLSSESGVFVYQSSDWTAGGVPLPFTHTTDVVSLLLTGSVLAAAGFLPDAVIGATRGDQDGGVIVSQNDTTSVLLAGTSCPDLSDITVDPNSRSLIIACKFGGLWTVEFGADGPNAVMLVPSSVCAPCAIAFDTVSERLVATGCASTAMVSIGGVSMLPVSANMPCDLFGSFAVGPISGSLFLSCGPLYSIQGSVVTMIPGVVSAGLAADESRGLIVASSPDAIVVIDDRSGAVIDSFPLPASCAGMSYLSLATALQLALSFCSAVSGSTSAQFSRLSYSSGFADPIMEISGCQNVQGIISNPLTSDAYISCSNDASVWWLVRVSTDGAQSTFSLPDVGGLRAMLFDPRSSRLLIGGESGLLLFDPITAASIPLSADACDGGLAFDASFNLYASSASGELEKFSPTFLPLPPLSVSSWCLALGPVATTTSGVVFVGCPGYRWFGGSIVGMISSSDFVCPIGFFFSNLVCLPCPIGTARGPSTATRFQCEPCAPGSVAPNPGMASCTICAAGQFAPSPQALCLTCPGNSASTAGSVSCFVCGAGQRAVSGGCKDCPPGRYSFGLASNCTECDAGWVSDVMSSHCSPCSAGRFQFNSSYCAACAEDQYSGVAEVRCNDCPVGRFSLTGSLDCSVCPPGSERTSNASVSCTSCSAGKFASGSGASCVPCEGGWTSDDGASLCLPCAAGRFRFNASQCEECAENQFSGVAATACSSCSAGQFAARGSLFCNVCAAGSAASANATSCSACAAGRFALNSPCLDCVPGTVSNSSAGACVSCEPGSSANSTAHPWPCDLCAPGRYAPTTGSPVCVSCAAGSVQPLSGQNDCRPCPVGFSTNSVSGQLQCSPCDSFLYSNTPGSAACSYCPTHVISDPSGAHIGCSNVTNCLANYELNLAHECVPCAIGEASYGGGRCSPCLPGTFTPYSASGCELINGQAGIAAPVGLLTVQAGWWMWISTASNGGVQLHAAKCPQDYCAGAQLQSATSGGNSSSTDIRTAALHQCAYPRADFNANYLCAECATGYREWGSECLHCSGTHAGFLTLAFLMLLCLTLALMLVTGPSSSSTGLLTIALYFGQSALLEVGSLTDLLSWLHFLNFDARSVGVCLAQWSAYEQMLAALCVPLVMLTQLAGIAVLQLALRARAWSHAFNGGRYLAVALQILIFCFNRTAVTCVNYFTCVQIADARRVFAWPTLDCSSSTYRAYLIVVVAFFTILVCGLPLVLSYLLWRYHAAVFAAADRARVGNASDRDSIKPSRSASVSRDESHYDPDSRNHGAVSPLHERLMESASWQQDGVDHDAEPESPRSHAAAETQAPSTSPAALSGAASLLLPVLLIYHRRAWFWPAVQLIRRVIFVSLNVALSSASPEQYFSYVLLHFAALLLHLLVSPFASSLLNRCECISLVMLTLLSMLLTAFPSPYTLGFEALLFFMVVPTLAAFLALTLAAACRNLSATLSTSASPWLQPLRRRFHSMSLASRSPSFSVLALGLGAHSNAGSATPREMNTRKHSMAAASYEPPQPTPLRQP